MLRTRSDPGTIEKMPLSPFCSILRLHATAPNHGVGLVGELLQSVASEYNIFQKITEFSPLSALLASLRKDESFEASESTYKFLDNCILRLVRKPIKYLGDVNEYMRGSEDPSKYIPDPIISLLVMAIVEQWPFVVKDYESVDLVDAAAWIARYFTCSRNIGEDSATLEVSRDLITSHTENKQALSLLDNASRQKVEIPSKIRQDDQKDGSELETRLTIATHPRTSRDVEFEHLKSTLESNLQPPAEAEDHPGLNRWSRKDVLETIEDGALADLVECLCSEYEEIRRQAIVNLKLFMSKLEVGHFILVLAAD